MRPVKTAALIQMKVWIRRNFSSCSSTENSSSRCCTLANTPSPRARNDAANPRTGGGRLSIGAKMLRVATAEQNSNRQPNARGDRDRLVRVGPDGFVGVFGSGYDFRSGAFVQIP